VCVWESGERSRRAAVGCGGVWWLYNDGEAVSMAMSRARERRRRFSRDEIDKKNKNKQELVGFNIPCTIVLFLSWVGLYKTV